jgi:hypothetical protein
MILELKRLSEEHERRIGEFAANYRLLVEREKKAFAFSQAQMIKMENQMILIYDY